VATHFTDISRVLETEEVTYDLTGSGCQPSYFAYTHKGDRTVWLCNQYFGAPQIGIDSKFGTLDHEWSHAVSSTDDNAYGQDACHRLAATDPNRAVNNADSHEYFAELGWPASRQPSPTKTVARQPDHLDVFWMWPDGAIGSQWWDAARGQSWGDHSPFPITPPGAAR
jgi:hypothetical protein